MFEHGTDILELLKNFPISVSILCVIPFVILSGPVSCVNGAHEFPVFRMQQFDLHQMPAGSRSALVNMEARPLSSEVLTRRCVVTKLSELTIDRFREAVESGAGGFLILLPRNFVNVTQEQLEGWQVLEKELLSQAVPVAVYFAYQDDYLDDLHRHIQVAVTSDQASSAFEALLGVTSASGYQLVATAAESKQNKDKTITNIQGKLAGLGVDENLPTIAIVAHYDTFGVAPSLANGSDSNGSGVVAVLELARIFSRLYSDVQSHAKYHLVFFLSGGGKFNYQGTKKWLEESIDNPEQSVLNEVDFVLCLDSISQGGDNLYLHVSKPPKEGTRAFDLVEELKMVAATLFPQLNFSIVHKKINLAEEMLSWEHERFSIHTQRLPAGTLSRFEDSTSSARRSMFDIRINDDTKLERNINFIAEALARHIFNLTQKGYSKDLEVFTKGLTVDSEMIKTWMNYLGNLPRPAQALNKDHTFLQGIELALSRYIKDIKKTTVKADKRDPEFVFYDQLDSKMSAYRVKPAVFDLFLAVGIGSYLGMVYVAMTNFSLFSDILQRQVVSSLKIKQS